MKITCVCESYSNTCDSSRVDQFVLTMTRGGCYKEYSNQRLNEIIVQMGISSFVDVMDMTQLFRDVLHGRKDVDRYIICNLRLQVCKRTLELDNANIDINIKHFGVKFIGEKQWAPYTIDKVKRAFGCLFIWNRFGPDNDSCITLII